MTTIDSVRPVTEEEQRLAVEALVLAFSSDPMMRWLFPDPHHYLAGFPRLVRALGGRAFEHGTAFCAGDFAAAALWLPAGVTADEEELVALIEEELPESQHTLYSIIEQLDEHHPAEPHWYLPVIGVDPPRQGRGYGSALLARALEQCDATGAPAYLESSNDRNIPLYERHGFEVTGTVRAGEAPPLYPMVRRPR